MALPDKLSDLLELSVKDAQAVEALGVTLDMTSWFQLDNEGKVCSACLAGAVMAQTLGIPPDANGEVRGIPQSYDIKTVAKLKAIDDLRQGYVDVAVNRLGKFRHDLVQSGFFRECEAIVTSDYIAELERSSWETYLKLAAKLREQGL